MVLGRDADEYGYLSSQPDRINSEKMKRTFRYIAFLLAALLAIASCIKQEPDMPAPQEEQECPEGKVKIQFNVTMPELKAEPATKTETRDSLPNINTMHVAVFGGSGYLKEYTLASLISTATTNYYGQTADIYTYEVELSLTNSSIKVHFLGNGPETMRFDYETNLIPTITKSVADDNSDGYWQRITIENGIQAKRHSGTSYKDNNGKWVYDGDYIDASNNLITNGEGYVASDETIAALSNVQLIRNFAKVSVEAQTSNFTLLSYSVINEPSAGTFAPYKDSWIDYLDYSDKRGHGDDYDPYTELAAVYPGVLPIGATFDTNIPAASLFESPDGTEVHAEGNDFYIYERPLPEDNPTFLIIYGTYTEDGVSTPCYYKIDLMEKGLYLALYRNFQYKIVIKTIKKKGKTTPKAAAEGAGTGDISADINAANLTDISDGTVQLYVLETAPVIVGQQNDYQLQYKFVTDVTTGDSSVNNYCSDYDSGQSAYCISFSGGSGSGDVISSYTLDSNAGTTATSMYRTLHFTTKSPSTSTQKETFRITGSFVSSNGVTHTLYRDIVFTRLNVQKLSVQCIPSEVPLGTDENVTVRITIPKGLPKSMFPLQFPIETAQGSLDPRTDVEQNLPVKYGQTYQYTETTTDGVTTKTRKSNNSYYFVRTLSYAEYESAESEVAGTCYFDSYFKTIKDTSASEVYVGCLRPVNPDGSEKSYDYFEPDKDEFTNYSPRYFTNISTPDQYFWEAGTDNKELSFSVDTDDIPSVIYVTLTNLEPASSGSNLIQVSGDVYKVDNIPADGNISIKIKVPDALGMTTNVTLEAPHYQTDSSLGGVIGEYYTGYTTVTTTTTETQSTTETFTYSDFSNDATATDTAVSATLTNYVYRNGNNGYINMSTSTSDRQEGDSGSIRFSLDDNVSGTVVNGNVTTITSAPWLSRVVFTYYSDTYSQGTVTPYSYNTSNGYSRSGTSGTWNGTADSGLYFIMDTYSSGWFNRRYYPNRITNIAVTYSYTVTTETTTTEYVNGVWRTSED